MLEDAQAQKNSQRATLRRRKGWKGFVWGYKDWVKAVDTEGRWDLVDWGEDGEKSGARSIERTGNKLVYKY